MTLRVFAALGPPKRYITLVSAALFHCCHNLSLLAFAEAMLQVFHRLLQFRETAPGQVRCVSFR